MSILNLHLATPTLSVIDPRGLAVRSVAYWREKVGQAPAARPARQVFDGRQRLVEQWDARLAVPALRQTTGLSAKVLSRDSVDAGWRVFLFGEADQVLAQWDGRGSRVQVEYDTSLRPLTITEQATADTDRVVERFEYGSVDSSTANQCGRVTRHDDPAGTRHMTEYDLLGLTQCEVSHFLQRLEPPDWPLDLVARDALLENAPGLASRWVYSPLGDLLNLTDAQGHCRRYVNSVAGQLKEGWLQPANAATPEQCLVRDIRYNHSGKVERETAGNGVVTEAKYALSDGRLERLCAGLPNAEPLQDLRYSVDPVGNIIQIDDQALPIRYFKNQRIDPLRTCSYDTLGQLVSATGWEATGAGAVLNYREEYGYDAGGNMTELRHLGAQSFTRRWAVAPDSNRSLIEGDQPPDFSRQFDANGNLQCLQPGQSMTWDLRNQLSSVSPVVRDNEADDTERYIYGGGGKRLRKVRTTLTHATTVIAEVRYLPGLELHRRPTGQRYEMLDLEAGRNRVTWFHGPGAPEHPLRYQFTDHLGSVTLELDEQANVQSREAYYPFGGTAWEDHRDQTGAYKTIRYSGKTKDATGLYYYGFRYYAPWLSRWINPDPAGEVDGLNLYGFLGNSPVGHVDADGRMKETLADFFDKGGEKRSRTALREERSQAIELGPEAFLPPVPAPSAVRVELPDVLIEGDIDSQASVSSIGSIDGLLSFAGLVGDQDQPSGLDEIRLAPLSTVASSPGPAPASPVAGPSSAYAAAPSRPACPTCNKVFSTPYKLRVHIRSHTGEKPFKCDVCSAEFSQKSNLNKHIRAHSGVKRAKSFVCPTCGIRGSDNDAISRHMLTHTTEKSFVCDVCGKAFAQMRGLALHKQTHEAVGRYSCPHCEMRFSINSNMHKHVRMKHPTVR